MILASPAGQLAVLCRGSGWVLLDERAMEMGVFASEGEALCGAVEHVRRIEEERYVLVQGQDGWREAHLTPGPAH